MSAIATTERGPGVAYAIGREVGSAPVRNRVRRRLRASMHGRSDRLDPGLAYLVGASAGAEKLSFSELDRTVEEALVEVHGCTVSEDTA